MKKITVKPITKENEDALSLPNDPFLNTGLVIPKYDGEKWSYTISEFPTEKITEDCFPDEHYKLENMGEGFYGLAAYIDGVCAGFAVFYVKWNKYLYLDNLLVSGSSRREGVGRALLNEGMKLALSLNKIGISCVCQDNNPKAAKFYFANGFELGGVDSSSYDGTSQEGKKDLFLYKRIR